MKTDFGEKGERAIDRCSECKDEPVIIDTGLVNRYHPTASYPDLIKEQITKSYRTQPGYRDVLLAKHEAKKRVLRSQGKLAK